jgi:hypothetical protein
MRQFLAKVVWSKSAYILQLETDTNQHPPHRFHREVRDVFCCVEQRDCFENEFVFPPRHYLINNKFSMNITLVILVAI